MQGPHDFTGHGVCRRVVWALQMNSPRGVLASRSWERPVALWFALATVVASACATAPTGTVLEATPAQPTALDVSGKITDTVVFLNLQMQIQGVRLGGYYDGLLKVFQGPLWGTAEMENNWVAWMGRTGTGMLRQAGYHLKEVSTVFGAVQDYSGVQYAFGGRLTRIEVDTYGSLAGGKTVASLDVTWEVLNLATHNVLYSQPEHGYAETAGTSGDAVLLSLQQTFAAVLADPTLFQALLPKAPAFPVQSAATSSVAWRRALPQATDLVSLMPTDADVLRAGSTFQRVSPAVVTLVGDKAQGTAFLISRDGLALTNDHVVRGQTVLHARFAGGREMPVRLVRSDSVADVALVEVECDSDCVTADISPGPDPAVGTEVYVIGAPLGLSQTLTRGVVSALRLDRGLTLVQTDASINHGNSGGPIVDAKSGRVLGIVEMKLVGNNAEGLGFGISLADALRVLGIRR